MSDESGACVPFAPTCGALQVRAVDGSCTSVGVPPDGCAEGFTWNAGGCDAVLPAEPCASPTMAVPGDTECRRVGVSKCADGFVDDGTGGCNPVQPATACPKRSVAFLGETKCHPVGTCPAGKWADAPVGSTLFVDAGYTGAGSDGTVDRPFVTIGAAIASATTSTTTLALSGVFHEDVTLDKSLHLLGGCNTHAVWNGTSTTTPAVTITAAGASIDGVAMTSPSRPVVVSAKDVVLSNMWISGSGAFAVDVSPDASVTIRDSSIESIGVAGVLLRGGEANIVHSVIRDSRPTTSNQFGRGIAVEPTTDTVVTKLTVTGSVISGGHDCGIYLQGWTQVTVDGSLIRDVDAQVSDKQFGWGIGVIGGPKQSELTVRGSVIAHTREYGILLQGAKAIVEDSVIRDVASQTKTKTSGDGILVQDDPVSKRPGALTVRNSVLERNHDAGVLVSGADATIDTSIVRGTLPRESDGGRAAGIATIFGSASKKAGNVTVTGSLVESNVGIGVLASPGDVTVVRWVVRDTQIGPTSDSFGIGAMAQILAPTETASLTVKGSLFERNHAVSIAAVGAKAVVDGTFVRDTLPSAVDDDGYGVGASDDGSGTLGELLVTRSTIARNTSGGVFAFGAGVTLEDTTVRDQRPTPLGTGFGRGLDIFPHFDAGGIAGPLVVRRSLFDGNAQIDLFVSVPQVTIESVIVRGTRSNELGFGDGIVGFANGVSPVSIDIHGSLLDGNARAGASAFGVAMSLAAVTLTCNGFDLDVEPQGADDPTIDDRGANVCGCGAETHTCSAQSANLAPVSAPRAGL
ncbi:MAG: right-handed parallel beta-helix repeat-containing protein [Polyangiales bacterium]